MNPIPVYLLEDTGEDVTEQLEGGGSRTRSIFRDSRNGKTLFLDEAEPGAVWNAKWMIPDGGKWEGTEFPATGLDGQYLCVKLPNGFHWAIDSQARNCDRKGQKHHCWNRHGSAKDGTLHVDKTPEPGDDRCGAGAGSIWSDQGGPRSWHGHLHGGRLVQC